MYATRLTCYFCTRRLESRETGESLSRNNWFGRSEGIGKKIQTNLTCCKTKTISGFNLSYKLLLFVIQFSIFAKCLALTVNGSVRWTTCGPVTACHCRLRKFCTKKNQNIKISWFSRGINMHDAFNHCNNHWTIHVLACCSWIDTWNLLWHFDVHTGEHLWSEILCPYTHFLYWRIVG